MKKILYIFLITLAFTQAGCSDWLDVQQLGQTEEDTMFDEESGFLRTLTGSYILLSSKNAYGYELTAGFPEEIVHNWTKTSDFYVFNYQEQIVEARLYATWNQLYKSIANLNLLLDNLKKKDEADFEYYNVIKGEALGLRAYLHLDLLRMFGPVLTDGGMGRKAIPYHETFSRAC